MTMSMDADSKNFGSAKNKCGKFFLNSSGRDSAGVFVVIRLSTLKVASILDVESKRDIRVSGQIVSSCNVSVTRLSFFTRFFEIRLDVDPESKRHRATDFPVFPSILTSTVGKRTTRFCRMSAESEAVFDVEGTSAKGFVTFGIVLFVNGMRDGDRARERGLDWDREGDLERCVKIVSFNFGFTWSRVW